MTRLIYHVSVLLIITLQAVTAQIFPANENGKINFYEVSEVDSLTKSVLYRNATRWITSLKTLDNTIEWITKDSTNGKLSIKSIFSVYTGSGILKKLSGKFYYNINVEVKNNRYRYSFSDFIYHEYKSDRYHNILPTGNTKNLEETKALGWQKLWDKHRKTLDEKINSDIRNLKTYIIVRPKKPEISPVKKEVKWDD
jgi:hypothetical protein